MSDLIDKQAAIDGKISIQRTNGVEIYSDEAVPVEYLKRLPSAEAEPVRHGKWKPFDLTYGWSVFYCTNCEDVTEVPRRDGVPQYRYCPRCGARMDK